MPPQNQAPESGANSDPNYNFIFNGQKPKRKFSLGLGGGNNLVRTAIYIISICVVLGVLIIVLSSVFGPKGINKKQLVDVVARAQEISRVSTLVNQQFTSVDQGTANLAASTSSALTSEEVQLLGYLSSNHVKISSKDFNAYLNKNIDAQLQIASQNNILGPTYYSYLKRELLAYRSAIKNYYNTTPANAQPILQNADASAQTLLNDSQLATITQ